MKAHFSGYFIETIVGVVPSLISYFDEEMHHFVQPVNSSLKLKSVMGYSQHRIEKNGRTTYDYAIAAIGHALELSEVAPSEVDALFLVTQTPEYVIPSTSSLLHGELNLKSSAYCVDINDGCAGYIKGLYEAISYLQNTGEDIVILVAGDVLSAKVSKYDRNSYPLLGDAVTCTVIKRAVSISNNIDIQMNFDGKGARHLIIPAGGARHPCDYDSRQYKIAEDGNKRNEEQLKMDGAAVFEFTQKVVAEFLEEFISKNFGSPSLVERAVFHQANKFIIDRLASRLGLDPNIVPTEVIDKYGNSSSATIPMTLVTSGEKSKKNNVLLSGFGVGLSWGAAKINLSSLRNLKIVEV